MYTECPHCHAIFRVTQAILQAAAGKVRCGECGTVFQAVKPQTELPPHAQETEKVMPSQSVAETTAPPESEEAPGSIDQRASKPRPEPFSDSGSFHRSAEPEPAAVSMGAGASSAALDEQQPLPKYLPIPTQTPAIQRASRRAQPWLVVLAIILTLVLIAQALIANRDWLGTKPALRPIVTGLCKVAGCTVPEHRDLDKIELLNTGVFSHPTVPGALMIKAVIENRADFEQPYPIVELAFNNIQGKRVAMRRFGPSEYLDPMRPHPKRMPVGKPVSVRLEVVDPGKDALGFDFNFR